MGALFPVPFMKVPLRVLAVAWSAVCAPSAAAQSSYPPRPVRLLVGFAPGGTTDVAARMMVPALSAAFDQQFYVDNRPGAGGNIATELAARAAPDGCTLLVVSAAFSSNISVYPRAGYDPLRDFAPVTRIAAVHNVLLVHPSVLAQSVQELVGLARKHPGDLVYASPGHGSTPQAAGVRIE